MRRSIGLCSLCALLAAPALADPAASVAAPTIRVEEAWIRWLPAGVPAAGYATLSNTGEKPVTLVAAASSFFREVSIHRSLNRGGSVRMEPVAGITIDPHSRLEFASTGYHLMLMGPTESLEAQRAVLITLRFADGTSLVVPFELRKPAAGGPLPEGRDRKLASASGASTAPPSTALVE
jgi:copper(I)-binding protein